MAISEGCIRGCIQNSGVKALSLNGNCLSPGLATHFYYPSLINMTIESFPIFTPAAEELWANIPSSDRRRLLSNVWCSNCRINVTIANFSGVVKDGNLLLVGLCSECRGDVARVIETLHAADVRQGSNAQ